MADILVFCEVADGAVKKSARELLGKAQQLAVVTTSPPSCSATPSLAWATGSVPGALTRS